MILFLDTNILIDFVSAREPFSKWAYFILRDQKSKKWQLWTTGNAILTTYYILEKYKGNTEARMAIGLLLKRLHIQPISLSTLQQGNNILFKDYEDGVQYAAAQKIDNLDYFITRNKKDFKNSTIQVLSPEELYI